MAEKNLIQIPENLNPPQNDWLISAIDDVNPTFQKIRIASLQKFPNTSSGLIIIDTIIPGYSLNSGSLTLFKYQSPTEVFINLPSLPSVGDSVEILLLNCDLKLLTSSAVLGIPNIEIEFVRSSSDKLKLYYLGEPDGWWEINNNISVKKLGIQEAIFNPEMQGIFYNLGTNWGTESYQRADLRGVVIISASSLIDTRTPQEAIDRQEGSDQNETTNPPKLTTKPNPPASYNQWHSNSAGTNWWKVDFQAATVNVTQYLIQGRVGSYGLRDWLLEGSNDDTNWTVIDNPTVNLGVSPYEYTSTVLTHGNFYRYYRFTNGVGGYAVIGEVELFGELDD